MLTEALYRFIFSYYLLNSNLEVRKRESDRFIINQRKGSDDEQGSEKKLPEHRTAGVNHGRINFPFRDSFVIGQS